MCLVNPLICIAAKCSIFHSVYFLLYNDRWVNLHSAFRHMPFDCFTLSNARWFYLSKGNHRQINYWPPIVLIPTSYPNTDQPISSLDRKFSQNLFCNCNMPNSFVNAHINFVLDSTRQAQIARVCYSNFMLSSVI